MTNNTLKLTDREVLQHAHTVLAEHLPLQADGYTCTTDDLLDVLLGVAVNRGTIEAVCADLVGTPDAETIRGYFKDQLRVEDLPELERRLNAALSDEIPPRVWRQARAMWRSTSTTGRTMANSRRRSACGYAGEPEMARRGSIV